LGYDVIIQQDTSVIPDLMQCFVDVFPDMSIRIVDISLEQISSFKFAGNAAGFHAQLDDAAVCQ
jgi:hypothetical protein